MADRALADALQLSPALRRLYEQLRPADGTDLEQVAAGLAREVPALLAELEPLLERGVVRVVDGRLRVAGTREALTRLVLTESQALTDSVARLTRIAEALPALTEEPPRGSQGDIDWIDAELVADASVPSILVPWIEQTRGELLLLRPDQWQLASEPAMFAAMGTALEQGRSVRSIYPLRALKEAPEVLKSRSTAGEQVRLLPEVPTRLAVVGATRALLPDPPGTGASRLVVMRHPGVIELLVGYFDGLWNRAVALPLLLEQEQGHLDRRLLLGELARGVRDEEIARTLGVSLRTVRRRIAAVMIELGADTRFQAGLEAARRGWL